MYFIQRNILKHYHLKSRLIGSIMPIFKSKHPDISCKSIVDFCWTLISPTHRIIVPEDVTIWEWLFEKDSKACPLNKYPEEQLAGYVDALTKERVSWKDVKEAATSISTVLVKEYGLGEGDTLSLFSRNTIWYPVMLFAAMRVGTLHLFTRNFRMW